MKARFMGAGQQLSGGRSILPGTFKAGAGAGVWYYGWDSALYQ